jgi:cephalosporin-C deacetylase-like acetyl esterase
LHRCFSLANGIFARWNRRVKYLHSLTGLIVLLAACGPTELLAQAKKPSTNYTLTVSTERPTAIYKLGETVTFNVKLLLDQSPAPEAEVQWLLSKDGVPPTNWGKLKLVNGTGAVTGKLAEPGFLQCRVTYQTAANKPVTATGGAGVDPLQIKPSLPAPDDFDAFWAAKKKLLAAVPVNARLTPVKSPQAEVECFDLQADSVGAPVSGYFARPIGAKPKSMPIILTVHGAGVRNSNLGGAASWAGQGFLALDINAHGLPNGKPQQFYTDLANSELKDYRNRGRDSRETIYFLGMFLRLARAIDFLTAQPEWDGRTLVVHGSSQGGAQSIVAAGLDARVTFFAAGVPAMCDHTGVAVGRVNGWPKLVPNGPDGKPDPKVLEAARYYDAMNFATRTKAAGILTVGFIDTTCPPTSVYAAYNALGGLKEIFNDPPSTHTVSAKAGQAMRTAILRHVEQMKTAK